MVIQNYLKTGWRNLVKHRFHTLVNILGLSVGMAFVMLIGGYVWNQLEVNKHLRNVDSLYLIQSDRKQNKVADDSKSPLPLAEALRINYPELVSNYYRYDFVSTIVSTTGEASTAGGASTTGERQFRDSVQLGDTSLVTMFGFSILHGDPRSLFARPEGVVITASKALKYFGRTDALGRILTIDNFHGKRKDFIVTGVLKDLPENSVTYSRNAANPSDNSIFLGISQMDFMHNMDSFEDWNNSNLTCYIELKKGVSPAQLAAPIRQLIAEHVREDVKGDLSLRLVPLNTFNLEANNGLNKRMVVILSIIALFILGMAIVNFVNISIGGASSRLKEIGIRKVLGGVRKQLIGQFLLESFIVVSISVFFAVLLYIFTRPVFGEIVGREISSLLAFPLYFLSFPILLILGVGLLAGGYPALLLSAVNPIATLKGKAGGVRENIFIRRLLVGFQFSTATMVFIAATIITTQVSYFLNSDLGFGKDQLISVFLPRDWSAEGVRHMEVIRNEMAQIPGVTHASISYAMPNRNSINSTNIYKPGEDSSHAVSSSVLVSDENYAGTFQIPLRAGIFFNHPAGDSEYTSIVLNETAVKELGWASAQEALGQSLKLSGGEDLYTVAGVVKDYHFESKRNIIKPLVFFHVRNWHAYRFLTFKISAANLPQTMNAVQDKWTSLMPSTPFDYSFMDETIENAYQSELQLKKASYAATLLAVFIVLLGILGIVSLSIGKKTREVGIRKVLGASGSSIVGIFLKEFIMILTLGILVAWPVVYLCMHTWLDTFAYRVTIGLSPFVGVGLCLTLFTVFIISVQTLKTAGLNPAGALRSE